jgi:hypothetical protein
MPFSGVWRWLDHHEHRRRQLVPTLSVVAEAAPLVAWAARHARPLARVASPTAGAARAAWLSARPPGDLPAAMVVPGAPSPVLLFSSPDLDAAARAALDFAEVCPRETVALLAAPAALVDYRRDAPPSRGKTLLLAGIIPGNAAPPAYDVDDDARSHAERFLFAQLEAFPATRGLFALNAPAGFAFGPAEAEVDLLCATRRLAVEIDGWHHFQDPDAYRRDRRKDLALQEHGFLVLRFLADDVVARLEDILATIVSAMETR